MTQSVQRRSAAESKLRAIVMGFEDELRQAMESRIVGEVSVTVPVNVGGLQEPSYVRVRRGVR
jgi:hypothetical protein